MALLPLSLEAQWQLDGVSVCDTSANTDPNGTIPQIAPDGEGGAYICWVDQRNGNLDIYAQRVDSTGNMLWQRNGVPVVTAPQSQGNMRIVNDGLGNAVIAWGDDRTGNTEVFVQKITKSGNPVWTIDGVRASSVAGLYITLSADQNGGALVGWSTVFDVVVQRLDNSGARLWGDTGVQVTNRAPTVYPGDVWIIHDSNIGAIVSWGEGNRVYAQCVDSSGVVRWETNGVLVSDSVSNNQGVMAVADGSGGAIINWFINVQGGNAYAQRVDSNGTVRWTPSGILLGSAGGGGGRRSVPNGNGGAFIGHGLFLQHVNPNGVKLWQPGGVPFTTLSSVQSSHARTPDGGVWNFCRSLDSVGFNLYRQWIDASGMARWGPNGMRLLTTNATQRLPQAIEDGRGNCLVVWEDYRGNHWGVNVAKVDTNGIVTSVGDDHGDVFPLIPRLHQNYPNPFNPTTTISYELPLDSKVILKLYDILGSEVQTLVNEDVRAGYHKAILNADNLATGVYFYRIQTERFTNTKKLLLLK